MERLAEPQPIGEHDRFAVLAKHIAVGAQWRVHRLDEKSELQWGLHGEAPVCRLQRHFYSTGKITDVDRHVVELQHRRAARGEETPFNDKRRRQFCSQQ
jgi:hypothetical protein